MFHPFAYDARYRTYLARFSGALTEQDLLAFDAATRQCLAVHGPAAGLVDFSHVDTVEISAAQTVSRGKRPQIMAGQKRAIVADGALFGMMRMFGVYQSLENLEPMIMRTLPEAYAALGLVAQDFHPKAVTPLSLPAAASDRPSGRG